MSDTKERRHDRQPKQQLSTEAKWQLMLGAVVAIVAVVIWFIQDASWADCMESTDDALLWVDPGDHRIVTAGKAPVRVDPPMTFSKLRDATRRQVRAKQGLAQRKNLLTHSVIAIENAPGLGRAAPQDTIN